MAQKINKSSLIFLLPILIILTTISKSTSLYPIYSCSNTTMFANNTQYQTNLNTLFTFLSSNSTTPTGFHQAVSTNGTATDEAVYGHFLCRGDQNATSCQDCVTTAVTIDLPRLHCPNRKEAIIWYDKCMVRYVGYMSQVLITTSNN